MPTSDRLRPAPFIAGLAGAITVTLTGVWLAAAPFAVGYQPDGADWVDATVVGVATGAGLVLVGLATLVGVSRALGAEVRRHGLGPARRPEPDAREEPDPTEDHVPSPDVGDLETILASLATALLADVSDGHHDHRVDESAATEPTP
jgi:hypothetical protein